MLKNKRQQYSDAQWKKILAPWKKGDVTAAELAKTIKRSVNTIYAHGERLFGQKKSTRGVKRAGTATRGRVVGRVGGRTLNRSTTRTRTARAA